MSHAHIRMISNASKGQDGDVMFNHVTSNSVNLLLKRWPCRPCMWFISWSTLELNRSACLLWVSWNTQRALNFEVHMVVGAQGYWSYGITSLTPNTSILSSWERRNMWVFVWFYNFICTQFLIMAPNPNRNWPLQKPSHHPVVHKTS